MKAALWELIWAGIHRRHLRPGARAAGWRASSWRARRFAAGAPAAPRPRLKLVPVATQARPRTDPTVARTVVGTRPPGTLIRPCGPLQRRTAAEPPRCADWRGGRRGAPGGFATPTRCSPIRGGRSPPARLFHRVAGRRPVRRRVHGRPAAHLISTGRPRTAGLLMRGAGGADPANPYGAAPPWPTRPDADAGHGLPPQGGGAGGAGRRRAGLVLRARRRSLLNFSADPEAQWAAASARWAGLVGAVEMVAPSRSSTVCRC